MQTGYDPIDRFPASAAFGVVAPSPAGTSTATRCCVATSRPGRTAILVNPREREIEGVACVASVLELPPEVKACR